MNARPDLVPTRTIVLLALGAVALYVVLAAANLWLGDLNQDEGWYLYAARQMGQGRLPYRDFAFTQGPVLPFVYSLAQPLVDRWGVAGGRLFTAVLGLLGAAAAAWLAARSVRRGLGAAAAVLAFILLAGNVYQSYFTTVVKTYSLCALFLASGLLALSFAKERGGWTAVFASGILLALAAGTRVSAGIAMPVAGVYLLLRRKELGDSRWLAFGIGGALGLAAISVPFLRAAPEGYFFAMYGYHAARSAGSLAALFVFKAGFISRFVQAYLVPACLGAALVLIRWCVRPGPAAPAEPARASGGFIGLLWAVGLGVTLVHLSAPFPYEDYQVLVVPVLAAALGASAVRKISDLRSQISDRWLVWLLVTVLAASVAQSFSSPVNQGWFVYGQDRIFWHVKEEWSLARLRRVGRWIRERLKPGDLLLTQDTYLAVEAGASVPPGLELGPFSYFPDLPTGRAKQLHVLNREMLEELLRTTPAPMAAFSEYGLAIAAPGITALPDAERERLLDLVKERYEDAWKVDRFGQEDTVLRILQRKPEEKKKRRR